jgi:hypothetical protein
MIACINLLLRFGADYRVSFEEGYVHKGIRRDKLDAWYMEIVGRFGTIFPLGGDDLGVMVDDHPGLAKKLAALPGCRIAQHGDREMTFAFAVERFPAVAAIVAPRRRRRVSDAERSRLADLGQQHGFKLHQPVQNSEAPTHANQKSDQNIVPAIRTRPGGRAAFV